MRRRRRHRGSSPIKDEADINYKNIDLLNQFTDDGGRILSRRKTRTPARHQRKLKQAIKRARHVALLPFTGAHARMHD